jgi:hypothetical protein
MYPTVDEPSENIRFQEDATTEKDASPASVRGGAGFEQRLHQLLEAADRVRTRAALLAAESQLTGKAPPVASRFRGGETSFGTGQRPVFGRAPG